MRPIVGNKNPFVNPKTGRESHRESRYADFHMPNGLRPLRIKAKMTQEDAAKALGLSKSGYLKKERSERGLSDDFIRLACELFGVSAEEIIGETHGMPFSQAIDPIKLEGLVLIARERLGLLPPDEAKEMIRSLISASRTQRGGSEDQTN